MGKCKDCKCGKGITIDNTFGHPYFYMMLQKMAQLHSVKNRDYGNGNPLGNFMNAEDLGFCPFEGVLVRMSDKWTRICSLTKQGEHFVKDESIEDTLLDLANYCLLALVIKRQVEKDKEQAEVVDGVTISEGQVSKRYVRPEDQIFKSFTCLTCVYFADHQDDKETKCYSCIFNGKKTPGSIDFYKDNREVARMWPKTPEDSTNDSSVVCCGVKQFCACAKCEKERFHNAM